MQSVSLWSVAKHYCCKRTGHCGLILQTDAAPMFSCVRNMNLLLLLHILHPLPIQPPSFLSHSIKYITGATVMSVVLSVIMEGPFPRMNYSLNHVVLDPGSSLERFRNFKDKAPSLKSPFPRVQNLPAISSKFSIFTQSPGDILSFLRYFTSHSLNYFTLFCLC